MRTSVGPPPANGATQKSQPGNPNLPPGTTNPAPPPDEKPPTYAVKPVPRSKFRADPQAGRNWWRVLEHARAAMTRIADHANVASVEPLGLGRFKVTRNDLSVFVVKVVAEQTSDGNPAEVVLTRPNQGVIRVSDRAEPGIVDRAVASALAQLSARLAGDQTVDENLTADHHPGSETELAPASIGREAELRNLAEARKNVSRLRVLRRHRMATEWRALVEHLGVHPEQGGGPQRRALTAPDVGHLLDQQVGPESRRPSWAGDPTGYPTWKAFIPVLAANLIPGLSAATAIAGLQIASGNSPVVAAGVALMTAGTAVAGTLVQRWYGRREKTVVDTGHGEVGKKRAYQNALRRKALLDPLLDRMRAAGIDVSGVGPAEPDTSSEPARVQPYWARLVARGLPTTIGAIAATPLLWLGLPAASLVTHWGIAGVSATFGPAAERFLRSRMVPREWHLFDNLAREVDLTAAEFDQQFVAYLHALMDRIDQLAGATSPTVDEPADTVTASAVEHAGPLHFGVNAAPGNAGDTVRGVTDAVTKVGNAVLDALSTGGFRAAVGTLLAAFLDRNFTMAEYNEIVAQVKFDFGGKMAEQVAQQERALVALLAEVDREVAAAESALGTPAPQGRQPAMPLPTPGNPAARPPGFQGWRAFGKLSVLQALSLEGVLVTAATLFNQGTDPMIVVGAASAGVIASFYLKFMHRRSEQHAVDERLAADRAKERVVEATEAAAVREFMQELISREVDAARRQREIGVGPLEAAQEPVAPTVPGELDPVYPDHIAALAAYERERLFREPRPWSLLGPRLVALSRVERLVDRVRVFAKHQADTRDSRPLRRALTDLSAVWTAYEQLVRDGTPMPADHELFSNAKEQVAETLRGYLERSVGYPGGRAFFAAGDPLLDTANRVPAQDGSYTIDMHGSRDGVRIGGEQLSVEQLAALIEGDPNWQGQPIRLFACRTGADPDGFAQRLADRLQVPVTAPTGFVGVADDGTVFVTGGDVDANGMPAISRPTGEMRTFQPRTNSSAHIPVELVESPVQVPTSDLDRHNPHRLRGGYEPSRAERELRQREIIGLTPLKAGEHTNDTFLAELDHGSRGVFKPSAGETGFSSDLPGNLGWREAAASRVDELLGFGLVPTTTVVPENLVSRAPHGPGSLQEFAENATPGLDAGRYTLLEQQRMAVFDYIIGNVDRHEGNYLTGPNGELVAIDHGYTFPYGSQDPIRSDFVRDHLNQPLDPAVLAAVRAVDVEQLHAALRGSGLATTAAELAADRLQEIKQHGMITGAAWGGKLVDAGRETVLEAGANPRLLAALDRLAGAGTADLRPAPRVAPVVGILKAFLDQSIGYPGGRAFFAEGDPLLDTANRVPPEDGVHTIDMHGSPDGVRIGGELLGVEHLAALIRADPNWNGQPIRLLACRTGADPNGFAQQLADQLGVPVTAPTEYVGVADDGTVFVTSRDVDASGMPPISPPTGEMRTFTPRAIGNGTATPLLRPPVQVSTTDLDTHNPWGLRGGDYQPSRREVDLANRTIVDVRPIGGKHANAAYLTELDDSSIGVFKPVSGERPNASLRIPSDLGLREVAASRVDELLGLGLVPTTAMNNISRELTISQQLRDGPGSLQRFAADASPGRRPDTYTQVEQQRMAVLDYVIGNTDRHEGNYLTGQDSELVAIDHGYSFPAGSRDAIRSDFIRDQLNQPLDPAVLATVRAADPGQLSALLFDLRLDAPAVDLAVARLTEVQRHGMITGTAWPGKLAGANFVVIPGRVSPRREPAAEPAVAGLLRRYLDQSVAYPGGRAFFAAGDPLRDPANRVPPEDGVHTIDMHGSPDGVRIGTDKLSVEHLVALLAADPNWTGQKIQLLACETGNGTDSFAQQLADQLGVPVIAPTAYVGFTADGTMFVTSRQVDANGMPALSPPTGEMRTFTPRPVGNGTATRVLRPPVQVATTDLDTHNPWKLRGDDYQPSQREVDLGNRTIVGIADPLGSGHANEAYVAELDDSSHGVFKPAAGEDALEEDAIPGDLARREVAAARVDELLGFDLVPTTAMNELPSALAEQAQLVHGPGSLQRFVEQTRPGRAVNKYRLLEQHRMAVLDYIIGNSDRHGGNYLTGPNGELVAIDHGYSFPNGTTDPIMSDFLRDAINRELHPEALSAVRAVDHHQLRTLLHDLGIGAPAVEMAVARVAEIQQHGMITGTAWSGQLVDALWQSIRKAQVHGLTDSDLHHVLLEHHRDAAPRVEPTVDEPLRRYLDQSVAYPGGRAFFAQGDPLLDTAHLVPSEDGTYTIDLHGGPDGVRIGGELLGVEHLAALIQADPNWNGQPIRLLACETGSGTNSFARQLADQLGVPVTAPTAYVGVADDGTVFVTSRDVDANGMPPISPPTGEMRTFTPRPITNGTATPLLRPPVHVSTTDLDTHNPWGLRGGSYQPSQRELELRNRTVTDVAPNGVSRGTNESYVAVLDDRSRGVFKPVAGEIASARKDIGGDLGLREVAAARVDEVFGFGLVPTTAMNEVTRELGRLRRVVPGPGSLQQFAENSTPGRSPEHYPVHQQQQMAVLDYVIGNTDRHDGNYLTGPNGELVAIDHGFSFPHGDRNPIRSDFLRDHVGRPLEPAVVDAVRAVNPNHLRAMLRDLRLDGLSIELTVARLAEVQQHGMITGAAWSGKLVDAASRPIRKGPAHGRADANAGRALRKQHWRAALRGLLPLVGGRRGDARDDRPGVVPAGDHVLRAGRGPSPGTADGAPGRGPGVHESAAAAVPDELLQPAGREPAGRVGQQGDRRVADLLRGFLEESVAFTGGRAFFASLDPLRDSAHRVPPEEGSYTIDMHGGPDSVRIGGRKLSVEHLAALLEADENWHGQPIRLLACRTGRDDDGFAQRLADRLGVPVTAPTDYAGFTDDGTLFVTSIAVDQTGMPPMMPPTGEMRTFTPRTDKPAGPNSAPLRPPGMATMEGFDFHNPWGLRGAPPAPPSPVRPRARGLYFPDHEDLVLGVNVDIGPDDPLPDAAANIERMLRERAERESDAPPPRRTGSPDGSPSGADAGTGDDADDSAGGSGSGGSGGDSGDGGSGGDSGDDAGEGQDEQPPEETPPPPGEIPLYAGDEQLWPDELADLVAGNPAWAGGPIRLYVRHGQLDPAFVQRLADLLGVTVLVPPEDVVEGFAGCSAGTLEVYNESEPVTPPGAGWHVFEPRTVAAATTKEAQ